MKNIALLITKLSGGGAEKTACNLSIELAKKYNVYVIVYDTSNITYQYDGEIIDLGEPASRGVLLKPVVFLKRLVKLKSNIRKHKIETVISFLEGPNLLNILSGRQKKTILSVRNRNSMKPLIKIRKFIYKYFFNSSDCIVSLSEGVKLDLIDNLGIDSQKIVTIYNPISNDFFDKKNIVKESFNPTNLRFINIGRQVKQKGQWHLIRVFNEFLKYYPNAHLTILGDGPLFEEHTNLIKHFDISNNVSMKGYVSNVTQFYLESDVFLFTSLFEGLGNSLLEALFFGLPIISTNCPSGPSEILDNRVNMNIPTYYYGRFGILTTNLKEISDIFNEDLNSSEKAYLQAMLSVCSNQKLEYLHKKSLERSTFFSSQNILEKWITVIEGQ
jgi:glycosyltransferase involved in cell wall biosynthesis